MEQRKEKWTIGSILQWTGQYFADKGVESPRLDAEVLLSHVLDKDRLYLYVHFDQPLEEDELAAFRAAVLRRAKREPVAYIVGQKEFMGHLFAVEAAVLIPRPDTEILVEAVLERLQRCGGDTRLLDIGTGSGAIIISLLKALPDARGVAIDLSPDALAVARRNAEQLGVSDRLEFRQGDLLEPAGSERFDVIVSNPPYIPNADIEGLEPEVKREPLLALAAGADGLDCYRRLLKDGRQHLNDGGYMALEVGIQQARPVCELARECGWGAAEVRADYSGIERVVMLEKG